MLHASIVVIGDEILGGFVRDANSGWLAGRLREHGIAVSWMHTVPDDLDGIGAALAAELARARPRVILTSGGIGSTPDDVTFEAVAAHVGVELVEDPVLSRRIGAALDWTGAQGVAVSDEYAWHMLRMARIPQGATLLLRDHGFAPGVRVDVDGGSDVDAGASIVVLPGVPSELRAIVTEVVAPTMLAGRNPTRAVAEVTHDFPESALNLCFAALLRRFPAVKLGSYPGVPMLVRLTGPPEDVSAAAAFVEQALADLRAEPGGQRLAAAWSQRIGALTEEDR